MIPVTTDLTPTIVGWSARPTTQEEINSDMPYLTSSMVEAIVTCPRWGIIHNVQHKRFVTGYRQMALEAGSLMHDVFAAFNLFHLGMEQGLSDHADFHGERLFPQGRYKAINMAEAVRRYDSNPLSAFEYLVFNVIGTSDYYDDPNDKNRTVAKLENVGLQLAHHYLTTLAQYSIHVTDRNDPTASIGVEKSLDVVFTVRLSNGQEVQFRFIGLADVLYHNSATNVVALGEYKTTSGMNDAWREAFRTRHQLSAYYGALHGYFENVKNDIIITGSAVPVRTTSAPNMTFAEERTDLHVRSFLTTALFAKSIVTQYPGIEAVNAPMFTHSCNRYFRPCSQLDLCTAEDEDRGIIWEQMEIENNLSPSEIKALLRKE